MLWKPFQAAERSGTPEFPCRTAKPEQSRSSAAECYSAYLEHQPSGPRRTEGYDAAYTHVNNKRGECRTVGPSCLGSCCLQLQLLGWCFSLAAVLYYIILLHMMSSRVRVWVVVELVCRSRLAIVNSRCSSSSCCTDRIELWNDEKLTRSPLPVSPI